MRSRRSLGSPRPAAPTRIANRISGSTSPSTLRWLPTNAPNRLRGMNMSTTAAGEMAGRAALVRRACCAWPLYSCTSRVEVSSSSRSPGCSDVHHHQAERRGDHHVREEQRERAAGERPEVRELAELHHAVRERREHERDHDEEQHAQEDLPERVEQRRGEPLRALRATPARSCAERQHHGARRVRRARGRAGCGSRGVRRCPTCRSGRAPRRRDEQAVHRDSPFIGSAADRECGGEGENRTPDLGVMNPSL